MLLGSIAWGTPLKYTEVHDIPYKESEEAYVKERCKLDIYYPEDTTGCPVVVWFHGGGLTQGNKSFPWKLKEKGMVLVAVNYAAVAWVFREIGKYGGDKRKIFVSGHSAGGYLTAMIGLDKKWLANYQTDANEIAGLIPFSGQMISHFAYRDMKGIGNLQPTIACPERRSSLGIDYRRPQHRAFRTIRRERLHVADDETDRTCRNLPLRDRRTRARLYGRTGLPHLRATHPENFRETGG